MKRVSFAEIEYQGKPLIISTVQMSDTAFESIAMRKGGHDLETVRTSSRDEARAAHEKLLKRYRSPEKKKAPKLQSSVPNVDGYKPGDLFYTSWGYEQTNIDYYQVVSVTAKTLTLREIGSEYIGGFGFAGECRAKPDDFRGEPFTSRRSKYGYYHESSHVLFPTTAEAVHHYSSYA